MIEKILKTDEEWRKILTPDQYHIMREKGTEGAYSCEWLKQCLGEGFFNCAACGLPLFTSEAKFESATGWPSYFNPISFENVEELQDNSLSMRRTEVRCARCESHLGHVFEDASGTPSGRRYCINSLALKFVPI